MTTAFAAVDALVALFEASVPADTTVFDGYPGTNMPAAVVSVGGTPAPTIVWNSKPAELGANRREEDYTVNCVASVAQGGEQNAEKAVRDTLAAVMATLETAIHDDPTLGGLVRYAEIVHGQMTATDATTAATGRQWTVTFSVRCTQRV